MNQITGYLPVLLTPKQESEYKRLLEEHYEAEYYEFDNLPTRITQILPYSMVSTIVEGIQRVAIYSGYSSRWHWYSYQTTDEDPKLLSLMKLS